MGHLFEILHRSELPNQRIGIGARLRQGPPRFGQIHKGRFYVAAYSYFIQFVAHGLKQVLLIWIGSRISVLGVCSGGDGGRSHACRIMEYVVPSVRAYVPIRSVQLAALFSRAKASRIWRNAAPDGFLLRKSLRSSPFGNIPSDRAGPGDTLSYARCGEDVSFSFTTSDRL